MELANFDLWDFQRLIHQPKNIHGLNLGLFTNVADLQLDLKWSGGYPKSCCLHVGTYCLIGKERFKLYVDIELLIFTYVAILCYIVGYFDICIFSDI